MYNLTMYNLQFYHADSYIGCPRPAYFRAKFLFLFKFLKFLLRQAAERKI